MRDGVMRLRHAGFRIRAAALLAAYEERDNPREIRLKGESHQIEHHLRMLRIRVGNAAWPDDGRQLAAALLFRALDAALEVANRFQILGQFGPIAWAESAIEGPELFGYRIENASVLPDAGEDRRAIGAVAGTEQSFEHRARISLNRQRLFWCPPRQRAAVGRAVTVLARPGNLVHL